MARLAVSASAGSSSGTGGRSISRSSFPSLGNGYNGQWHGLEITFENGTKNTVYFNGKGYMTNALGEIPQAVPNGLTSAKIAEMNREKGRSVHVIMPDEYNQRNQARAADRKERENIDYELGVGLPFGNAQHREAARRGRLMSRMAKRRGR